MDALLARSRAWFRHAASSGWRRSAALFYWLARSSYWLGERSFAHSIRQDVKARAIESDSRAKRAGVAARPRGGGRLIP